MEKEKIEIILDKNRVAMLFFFACGSTIREAVRDHDPEVVSEANDRAVSENSPVGCFPREMTEPQRDRVVQIPLPQAFREFITDLSYGLSHFLSSFFIFS